MSNIKNCDDCGIEISTKRISGLCKRCYQRRYREAHREKQKAYDKHYYTINKDRICKRVGQYSKANRDKLNDAAKKWHVANPEKASIYSKRWRTAHPEEKQADGRRWREKNPEYFNNYQEANRDRILEQRRLYRESHPNYFKDYREANLEKIKTGIRNWVKRNPERKRELNRRRRTSKANAEGSFTELQFQVLLQKYNNRCLCCGESFTNNNPACRDHIIPLSRGGLDDIDNIQPLCRSCNCKKGTKTVDYR